MTATISPATIERPTPNGVASPESSPRPTKRRSLPNAAASDASNSRPAIRVAMPTDPAPGGSDTPATKEPATPILDPSPGPDVPDPAAIRSPAPTRASLLDPALYRAAEVLDDIEQARKAIGNRLGQMTRKTEDKDGIRRGFGYDLDDPDLKWLVEIFANLKLLEHKAELELGRRMRKHPLGGFERTHLGVGEKQLGRLLALIGDPYINSAKGGSRTVYALNRYCGLDPVDGQARRRRKGELANWSGMAKSRAWNIAKSCIKVRDNANEDCRDGHFALDTHSGRAVPGQDNPQEEAGQIQPGTHVPVADPSCGCSPYRVVYDRRRAHTAITHPEWTDGHSHNDGLRIASKAILKDLWRAARDWHLTQESEPKMTDLTGPDYPGQPVPTGPNEPNPKTLIGQSL